MRLDPANMARLAECPDPEIERLAERRLARRQAAVAREIRNDEFERFAKSLIRKPPPRPGRIRVAVGFFVGVALTLLVMLLASKAMPQAALDLVRAGL